MDAELQRILEPDFLGDLAHRSVAEVRALRETCQSVETQLSYLRRLVQGRHDIVTGELDRRRHGGATDDVHGLVERLPEILADRIHAPGPGRLPVGMEPGELTGTLVDRLEAIGEVVSVDAAATTDEQLEEAATQLTALEHEVSGLRRQLFDRIDALQTEITRRYKDGEANVEDILARGS